MTKIDMISFHFYCLALQVTCVAKLDEDGVEGLKHEFLPRQKYGGIYR